MNVSKPRYENYIEQDFRIIIKIKLPFVVTKNAECRKKYEFREMTSIGERGYDNKYYSRE